MVIHLVFINVPIYLWILFLNLLNLAIMLPLDLLPLFPNLSFLWRWYLWYLCILPPCLYHCWHYKRCHHPPHLFWTCAFVPSYFFLTHDPKAPPSSALFFFLKTLLGDCIITFLIFSNATYISSLVLLTLACGFYGFSFQWTNKYFKIFAISRLTNKCLYPPYSPWYAYTTDLAHYTKYYI